MTGFTANMTEAEIEAEFEREDQAARGAFTAKWLSEIPHTNIAGGTTGVFIYADSLEDAKRIEDALNAKGVTNTDIHESYEPECGAWVCQATERNEFTFTGGNYDAMVKTMKDLLENMRIVPKYVYVDCNQLLINFKTEANREKFVKVWKQHRSGANVELDTAYCTTFQFRWYF